MSKKPAVAADAAAPPPPIVPLSVLSRVDLAAAYTRLAPFIFTFDTDTREHVDLRPVYAALSRDPTVGGAGSLFVIDKADAVGWVSGLTDPIFAPLVADAKALLAAGLSTFVGGQAADLSSVASLLFVPTTNATPHSVASVATATATGMASTVSAAASGERTSAAQSLNAAFLASNPLPSGENSIVAQCVRLKILHHAAEREHERLEEQDAAAQRHLELVERLMEDGMTKSEAERAATEEEAAAAAATLPVNEDGTPMEPPRPLALVLLKNFPMTPEQCLLLQRCGCPLDAVFVVNSLARFGRKEESLAGGALLDPKGKAGGAAAKKAADLAAAAAAAKKVDPKKGGGAGGKGGKGSAVDDANIAALAESLATMLRKETGKLAAVADPAALTLLIGNAQQPSPAANGAAMPPHSVVATAALRHVLASIATWYYDVPSQEHATLTDETGAKVHHAQEPEGETCEKVVSQVVATEAAAYRYRQWLRWRQLRVVPRAPVLLGAGDSPSGKRPASDGAIGLGTLPPTAPAPTVAPPAPTKAATQPQNAPAPKKGGGKPSGKDEPVVAAAVEAPPPPPPPPLPSSVRDLPVQDDLYGRLMDETAPGNRSVDVMMHCLLDQVRESAEEAELHRRAAVEAASSHAAATGGPQPATATTASTAFAAVADTIASKNRRDVGDFVDYVLAQLDGTQDAVFEAARKRRLKAAEVTNAPPSAHDVVGEDDTISGRLRNGKSCDTGALREPLAADDVARLMPATESTLDGNALLLGVALRDVEDPIRDTVFSRLMRDAGTHAPATFGTTTATSSSAAAAGATQLGVLPYTPSATHVRIDGVPSLQTMDQASKIIRHLLMDKCHVPEHDVSRILSHGPPPAAVGTAVGRRACCFEKLSAAAFGERWASICRRGGVGADGGLRVVKAECADGSGVLVGVQSLESSNATDRRRWSSLWKTFHGVLTFPQYLSLLKFVEQENLYFNPPPRDDDDDDDDAAASGGAGRGGAGGAADEADLDEEEEEEEEDEHEEEDQGGDRGEIGADGKRKIRSAFDEEDGVEDADNNASSAGKKTSKKKEKKVVKLEPEYVDVEDGVSQDLRRKSTFAHLKLQLLDAPQPSNTVTSDAAAGATAGKGAVGVSFGDAPQQQQAGNSAAAPAGGGGARRGSRRGSKSHHHSPSPAARPPPPPIHEDRLLANNYTAAGVYGESWDMFPADGCTIHTDVIRANGHSVHCTVYSGAVQGPSFGFRALAAGGGAPGALRPGTATVGGDAPATAAPAATQQAAVPPLTLPPTSASAAAPGGPPGSGRKGAAAGSQPNVPLAAGDTLAAAAAVTTTATPPPPIKSGVSAVVNFDGTTSMLATCRAVAGKSSLLPKGVSTTTTGGGAASLEATLHFNLPGVIVAVYGDGRMHFTLETPRDCPVTVFNPLTQSIGRIYTAELSRWVLSDGTVTSTFADGTRMNMFPNGNTAVLHRDVWLITSSSGKRMLKLPPSPPPPTAVAAISAVTASSSSSASQHGATAAGPAGGASSSLPSPHVAAVAPATNSSTGCSTGSWVLQPTLVSLVTTNTDVETMSRVTTREDGVTVVQYDDGRVLVQHIEGTRMWMDAAKSMVELETEGLPLVFATLPPPVVASGSSQEDGAQGGGGVQEESPPSPTGAAPAVLGFRTLQGLQVEVMMPAKCSADGSPSLSQQSVRVQHAPSGLLCHCDLTRMVLYCRPRRYAASFSAAAASDGSIAAYLSWYAMDFAFGGLRAFDVDEHCFHVTPMGRTRVRSLADDVPPPVEDHPAVRQVIEVFYVPECVQETFAAAVGSAVVASDGASAAPLTAVSLSQALHVVPVIDPPLEWQSALPWWPRDRTATRVNGRASGPATPSGTSSLAATLHPPRSRQVKDKLRDLASALRRLIFAPAGADTNTTSRSGDLGGGGDGSQLMTVRQPFIFIFAPRRTNPNDAASAGGSRQGSMDIYEWLRDEDVGHYVESSLATCNAVYSHAHYEPFTSSAGHTPNDVGGAGSDGVVLNAVVALAAVKSTVRPGIPKILLDLRAGGSTAPLSVALFLQELKQGPSGTSGTSEGNVTFGSAAAAVSTVCSTRHFVVLSGAKDFDAVLTSKDTAASDEPLYQRALTQLKRAIPAVIAAQFGVQRHAANLAQARDGMRSTSRKALSSSGGGSDASMLTPRDPLGAQVVNNADGGGSPTDQPPAAIAAGRLGGKPYPNPIRDLKNALLVADVEATCAVPRGYWGTRLGAPRVEECAKDNERYKAINGYSKVVVVERGPAAAAGPSPAGGATSSEGSSRPVAPSVSVGGTSQFAPSRDVAALSKAGSSGGRQAKFRIQDSSDEEDEADLTTATTLGGGSGPLLSPSKPSASSSANATGRNDHQQQQQLLPTRPRPSPHVAVSSPPPVHVATSGVHAVRRHLVATPQDLDLGTLVDGFRFRCTVQITNVGTSACRYYVRFAGAAAGGETHSSAQVAAGGSGKQSSSSGAAAPRWLGMEAPPPKVALAAGMSLKFDLDIDGTQGAGYHEASFDVIFQGTEGAAGCDLGLSAAGNAPKSLAGSYDASIVAQAGSLNFSPPSNIQPSASGATTLQAQPHILPHVGSVLRVPIRFTSVPDGLPPSSSSFAAKVCGLRLLGPRPIPFVPGQTRRLPAPDSFNVVPTGGGGGDAASDDEATEGRGTVAKPLVVAATRR